MNALLTIGCISLGGLLAFGMINLLTMIAGTAGPFLTILISLILLAVVIYWNSEAQ